MFTLLTAAIAVVISAGPTPILWYQFDEPEAPTVTNFGSLGPAYDGQKLGDVTIVPIDGGFAAQFDGAGDWVIPAGDEDALDIADGDFTMTARFLVTFLDPGLDGGRGLIWKERAGSNPGYLVAVRNGTFVAQGNICDGTSFNILTETTVNDEAWHDIAWVRTGQVLRLVLDGCLIGVEILPGDFGSPDNPNDLVIGGRTLNQSDSNPNTTFGVNDDFNGLIDEVRIYDVSSPPAYCAGDANCDGVVDAADLAALLAAWGDGTGVLDLDFDNAVGSADLAGLLAAWGPCAR